MSRAARSSCRPRRWRWTAAWCTSGTSSTPRTTSRPAASPSPTSRASIAGCTCRKCWPTRPTSGAAHIALTVGAERQRAWLKSMGMFGRTGIELPESARPIVQPAANWKELATMTVGFGHGISVTPRCTWCVARRRSPTAGRWSARPSWRRKPAISPSTGSG